MIARVFGQTICFDPCRLNRLHVETKRENVVHALPGMLRGEAALCLAGGRIECMQRIHVAGAQNLLHNAPRDLVSVLYVFPLRGLLALLDVDLLHRRVGIEIAAENVRGLGFAQPFHFSQDDLQRGFALLLVFFQCVRWQMDHAKRQLMTRRIDDGRFEKRFLQFLLQGRVVDRIADRPAAEKGGGAAMAFGVDVIHLQAPSQPFEHFRVVRLDDRDDVRLLREDNLGQRVRPAFAAVEDVVTHHSHHSFEVIGRLVSIRFGSICPVEIPS